MRTWKDPDYHIVRTEDQLESLLSQLDKCIKNDVPICVDIETTGAIPESGLSCYHDWILGISFAWDKSEGYYIPLNHCQIEETSGFNSVKVLAPNQLDYTMVRTRLNDVLSKGGVYIGHNIKFDYKFLWRYGVHLYPNLWDTALAIKLVDGDSWTTKVKLKEVISNVVDIPEYKVKTFEEAAGSDASLESIDQFCVYAINDVIFTLYLYDFYKKKIDKDYKKIFYEAEMPLSPVLAHMEMTGIKIDVDYLKSLRSKLENYSNLIASKFKKDYGINVGSTSQVGQMFNNKFKNVQLRTSEKGNIVTDVEALNTMLRNFGSQKKSHTIYKIARRILMYRGITKALNTYIDKFPAISEEHYKKDGSKEHIVHTTFNQIINSGRLSSSPNVQNIPRGMYADIRRGFVSRKGHKFVEADWKGVELRIAAAASGEPRMLEAFLSNPMDADLHTLTAQGLFEKDKVTSHERYIGKTINFSILYGATEYSVSKTLNCSKEEARKHIRRFYTFYSGLRDWREAEEEKISSRLYSETFFGRRRYIKNGVSPSMVENRWEYDAQVRALINHIIQGTSADILKFSMVKLANKFAQLELPSYLLTTTHDSIVVETKEPETTADIMREVMEVELRGLKLPIDLEIKDSFSKS